MLDDLRKSGSSIFIYLIFGLLIAIFVINIGPGSGNRGGGCSGSSNTVVTVDGKQASQTAFKIAYSAQPLIYGEHPPTGKQRVHYALEALIRREILANEANKRGINVSTEIAQEELKKGYFFYAGVRRQLGGAIFDEIDGTKIWSYKKYHQLVEELNVSANSFNEEQTRGLEAAMMSDLLTSSVRVSRDEAYREYLFNNTTATYDVVAFDPAIYRTGIRVNDADIERFAQAHETELKDEYKTNERNYKGIKPELKLRQIFIAKLEAKPADEPKKDEPKKDDAKKDDAKKDDAKKDDAKKDDAAKKDEPKKDDVAKKDEPKKDDVAKKPAVKAAGMPIEAAKAKLEAARAAIASGKQKFADAVKELSTNDIQKANGGLIGWAKIDSPNLNDKLVNDAVKVLKPGEMTPVIPTDHGVYLIQAEDKREGDLSYDQVKIELAQKKAVDVWSKEAARRAAIVVVKDAHKDPKAQKSLDKMFERKETQRSYTPEQIRQMQEMQRQIQQQMQQQGGGGAGGGDDGGGAADDDGPHGELDVHYVDVPAGWNEDPDGSGNSDGSAAKDTKDTKDSKDPKAPATGSAKADLMEPSKDPLPAFDVPAPKVEKHGPVNHSAVVDGINGNAKEISDQLFDVLAPGAVADRIFEVNGVYYVIQLLEKPDVDQKGFDKQADALVERMRETRAQVFLMEWLGDRCDDLKKANRINPAPDMIAEHDDQGRPLPSGYAPCFTMKKVGKKEPPPVVVPPAAAGAAKTPNPNGVAE